VEVSALRPNPFQPRTQFREEPLEDLKASIREHGILQPIVVRRSATGYEVIAGERRLRAARALDLATVPVVVRDASDEDMQTLALVENLQREDLNAIEQARALRSMMANFGWTQEDVATRVGKARTTIANMVRLLDLPTEIQGWVEGGALSGAHARALLQAKGDERRVQLAKLAMEGGWSVREVERRAATGPTLGKRKEGRADPFLEDLEGRLRQALGVPARIQRRGKGGRIEIRFHDADELDRLLHQMGAT
jgi:ParB family chromosome partitioning protein